MPKPDAFCISSFPLVEAWSPFVVAWSPDHASSEVSGGDMFWIAAWRIMTVPRTPGPILSPDGPEDGETKCQGSLKDQKKPAAPRTSKARTTVARFVLIVILL